VDLALDAGRFPDREALLALMQRLGELGRIEWIAVVVFPKGGGRAKFLVHDGPSATELRFRVARLVGEKSIRTFNESAARPV
jgi:hypothetical protein